MHAMNSASRTNATLILVVGDLIAYVFSLILTLTIRYGSFPDRTLFNSHVLSFSILFVIFLIISFSAGLYDKQLALIRGRVQGLLVRAQIINFLIGIAFFYFAPVAIAPKANLFIYFVVSTLALLMWRMIMFPVLNTTRKQVAILIGDGVEARELYEHINKHDRYGLIFREHIRQVSLDHEPTPEQTRDFVSTIATAVSRSGASIIVADLHNPHVEAAMPFLYSLVFSGVQIIDASKFYESIFDRIPIRMVGERWLVEHAATSLSNRRTYDFTKRVLDIIVASLGGLVSLIVYPFVIAAIKFEDGGPIFITQKRVGMTGSSARIIKFRSMSGNDSGNYDTKNGANGGTRLHITRVGNFLRKSRIDELPQFWNVIRGDLSLVGPRPELPTLASIYEKEIPYYNARHLVKPGLFGWAQIYHEAHPHHTIATEDTRDKLSYDLYYIKNRSLMLDIKIVLRTLDILMKRTGR
jgi:exopolysaccharide biosynthesis polyprenyl glycosylphosphotransferase